MVLFLFKTIIIVMVWLIIGIFLVMMIGLAALIRSLRLDGKIKLILSIFSLLSVALAIVALIGVINPDLNKTFVRIFFYSGLGLSLITLFLSVYLLRRKYNKVFTDKTKEHHESVARILAKEQEEKDK